MEFYSSVRGERIEKPLYPAKSVLNVIALVLKLGVTVQTCMIVILNSKHPESTQCRDFRYD